MRSAFGVLRRDRNFARYSLAQMLLGSANFMIEPVLVIVLIHRIGFGYFWTAGMMDIVPTLLMLLAMQFWAPYFDRVGVVQFRVINSVVWVACFFLAAASMLLVEYGADRVLPAAIAVLFAARVLAGIGRGGGAIAWHIGHLHFAAPADVELYMRVHMALTGLRGILLPQFSRLLNAQIGNLSFLVAVASGVAGLFLFWRLARDDRRGLTAAEARGETDAPPTPRGDIT